MLVSSSTTTTIHTPTAPFLPSNGVQCIQRTRPALTGWGQTPDDDIASLFFRFDAATPTSAGEFVMSTLHNVAAALPDNQRTLAVTPRPSARALVRSSRIRGDPPMRERKGVWRMPGVRREGEAKRMRREG